MSQIIINKEEQLTLDLNHQGILKNIMNILPTSVRLPMSNFPPKLIADLQEIRIRLARPIILSIAGKDYTITAGGKLSEKINTGIKISYFEMERIMHSISQSSIYAWEEEFRRGYITLRGGHRIGLAGKVILDKGLIKSMKNISGLNIRIAHELLGVADRIMPYIIDQKLGFQHTLLISPPQSGKTTLLRDIIRQLSDGIPDLNFCGVNVGLVDERSELAGSYEGIPQYNIGLRTDVLDGCPKAQGMIMLVRSMSPQIIATDEIGTAEDIIAIEEVLNAGINLLTTVHAKGIEDLYLRPNLAKIIEQKLFKKIIILGCSLGVGTIEDIKEGVNFRSVIVSPFKGGWKDC